MALRLFAYILPPSEVLERGFELSYQSRIEAASSGGISGAASIACTGRRLAESLAQLDRALPFEPGDQLIRRCLILGAR